MLPAYFTAIGSDRFLTESELGRAVPAHPSRASAWALYQDSFDGYCESRLDAQCHRFAHPARSTGRVVLEAEETVVVVGTGPSLQAALPMLARCRGGVRVFTSPRGADVLARHGIAADLVLVTHQTALDAHHSVRDGGGHGWRHARFVASDWSTPPALLAGVPADRLFVPEALPTWGLWPATAVAMAVEAGAGRVALLGIDLGTPVRPDPVFAPLSRLLTLVARVSGVSAIDCGAHAAAKAGWARGTLDGVVGYRLRGELRVRRQPALLPAARLAEARGALEQLAGPVERSRRALAVALEARRGHARAGELEALAEELMSWRDARDRRVWIQEALGVSFLPRLWRLGVSQVLGTGLWRPIALATHELVHQADRLAAHCRKAAA